MKKLLVLFAVLFTTPICAQITLEHIYDSASSGTYRFMMVDTNEIKFCLFEETDPFIFHIYNDDHSLYKRVVLPVIDKVQRYQKIAYASRYLFNDDNKIEFLCLTLPYNVFIINEDGDTSFSCFGCTPNLPQGLGTFSYPDAVINTSKGTKLFLQDKDDLTRVYSLPGKLLEYNTKLSVTAPTIISSSSPSTSAYPNPSNGKIRVAYSLPEGVTTGELVITTTDGREVKRYRVGNMFNDILIEKSELASGAYFYKLITERGQSEARKFVITN